jgi:hydrogenase-4 component F
MELAVIVLGFAAAAALSFVVKSRRFIEALSIVVTSISSLASLLVAYKVGTSGDYSPFSFVTVDALGAFVMLIVSIVSFFVALYAVPCFRKETAKKIVDYGHVRRYYTLSAIFLASIYCAIVVNNPVAAWIFLEGTTLSTVFLISFYGRKSSIEAAWKYMIINALGLLLAFLGTLLYFTAVGQGGSETGLISWDALAQHAKSLDPGLVQAAFIFVLIGYGTKVGLAPMHTWKPDAYGKSPAPLGALFSGALLPVSFLILIRFKDITDAAIGPAFSQKLLIAFGIFSMVIAAFSIVSTTRNKRLLAYSSIEHTGFIALSLGFGGIGVLAAVLHLMYHSFIKSSLFFLTGNMLLKFHSTKIADIRGAMSVMPVNSILYFVAVFAVAGSPPFGTFLTEFFALSAGVASYLPIVVIALLTIIVAFIGFFRHANSMVFGEAPDDIHKSKLNPWLVAPPALLLGLTLITTFYTPQFVQTLIQEAVRSI